MPQNYGKYYNCVFRIIAIIMLIIILEERWKYRYRDRQKDRKNRQVKRNIQVDRSIGRKTGRLKERQTFKLQVSRQVWRYGEWNKQTGSYFRIHDHSTSRSKYPHLICRGLVRLCVLVSEGPVEWGNVKTALCLWQETSPCLIDGWMTNRWVEFHSHRDALH